MTTDKFAELIADFEKDSKKENDGTWMTYKHFQYLVARSHRNNVAFFKLMEKELRPYQWAIDRGNFAAIKEVANEAVQKVYAETILRGVRRVGAVTEMPLTTDEKIDLFKRLPGLWDEIF